MKHFRPLLSIFQGTGGKIISVNDVTKLLHRNFNYIYFAISSLCINFASRTTKCKKSHHGKKTKKEKNRYHTHRVCWYHRMDNTQLRVALLVIIRQGEGGGHAARGSSQRHA